MKKDFPYRTLVEFLEANKLLNAQGDRLLQAKRDWQRMYLASYKKNYGKVQVNCVLSEIEFAHLELKSKEQDIKRTAYLRYLIECDMSSEAESPRKLVEIEVKLLELYDLLIRLCESERGRFQCLFDHLQTILRCL